MSLPRLGYKMISVLGLISLSFSAFLSPSPFPSPSLHLSLDLSYWGEPYHEQPQGEKLAVGN